MFYHPPNKSNRLVRFVLSLFTLSLGYTQAQEYSVIEDTVPQWLDYSQSYLNTSNGLLQNEINDLYLGSNRVLWAATNYGLARFTGKSCHVFTSANDTLLEEDRIKGFSIHANNQVTVRVASDVFPVLREDELALTQWKSKETRLFTRRGMVLDTKRLGRMDGDFFPLDSISAYELDPEDQSRVYYRKNGAKSELNFILSPVLLRNFFILEGQAFSFDRQGNILHFNGTEVDTLGKVNSIGSSKGEYPKLIWRYRSKAHYIVVDSALYKISIMNKALRFKCLVTNLPNFSFQACVQSAKDVRIFLGTRTQGVLILGNKCIKQVLNDLDCSQNQVPYNLQAIGTDSVISTTGIIYTPDSLICTEFMFGSNYSCPLAYDSIQKRLYTSFTDFPFGYIDFQKRELVRLTQSLPGGALATNIYRGEVYTFLESTGLLRLTDDKLVPLAQLPEEIEVHTARKIHFSKDSIVYINHSYSADPLVLDLKTGIYETLKLPGEKKKTCRFIWEKDDYLWFTTYGAGIFVKKGEAWLKFNPANYPQLEACHAIVPHKGDLIFSTNRGLFVFKYQEVLKFLNGEIEDLNGYSFGELDGLVETEFNGGVQYPFAKPKGGYIAFPNLKGVSFLKKDFREKIPELDGEVFLVSAKYDDESGTKPLQNLVPASFSTIYLDLAQVYYGDAENSRLYYRIPELGENWNPVDLASGITIARLPSNRSYTVELYAPSAKESNRYQGILQFKVAPTFYQTRFFYFLLVFGLSILVGLLFIFQNYRNRLHKNRLKEQIEERTKELVKKNIDLERAIGDLDKSKKELQTAIEIRGRVIAIISHDLRAPLKFYLHAIDDLLEGTINKVDRMSKLKMLKEGLKSSYDTANEVLDWVQNLKLKQETKVYPLEELVSEICAKHLEFFSAHNIQFDFSIDGKSPCSIPPVVFKTALDNILGNALKFCKAKVWLTVIINENLCTIEVNDDGLGVIHIDSLRKLNAGKGIKSSVGKRLSRGKGVGTPMVWEVLNQIGGKVKYRNTSLGFQVFIEIPIKSKI